MGKEDKKIKQEEEIDVEVVEKKLPARLIQVPTQFGLAIELEDGTQITDAELLVKIYNEIKGMRKVLG